MTGQAPSRDVKVLASHPAIVVGVPCYNEERFLAETLESVRSQTHRDFKVLVSDNASTDRTGEIARAFADKDPRFHYVRQPVNLGSAENFNFVRDASDSPYLMWLGAHDLLAPTCLEKHMKAMAADPTLSVSQSVHAWIDESGAVVEEVRDGDLDWGPPNSIKRYLASVGRNKHNIGANSVIRRALSSTIRFSGVLGTDRVLLSHLAYRGPFHTVDEVLYFRRAFETRDGFGEYMKRLTGSENAEQDWNWDAFGRLYEADFDSLVGAEPRAALYRVMLQALLRYHFPVRRTSLPSRVLWTSRRGVNAVRKLLGMT